MSLNLVVTQFFVYFSANITANFAEENLDIEIGEGQLMGIIIKWVRIFKYRCICSEHELLFYQFCFSNVDEETLFVIFFQSLNQAWR